MVTVLVQTLHRGTPGEKFPEVVFAGSEYGCVSNLYPYLPDMVWLQCLIEACFVVHHHSPGVTPSLCPSINFNSDLSLSLSILAEKDLNMARKCASVCYSAGPCFRVCSCSQLERTQ